MNDMVAIKSSKLPAHLQGKAKAKNIFGAAVTVGGFPVISIKGKVFHIQRGDERTLVTKPDSDDEPASALEAVILSANPNKSKVYYEQGYEQGSVAKPTCYSNDGTAPAADAEAPQSKKCAICPHNQWGSRVTDNGGKGKACGDSMRLAIAPAGQINDPMLLRVPAATLKTLGTYGAQLAKRGVEPHHVITKISFDYNVAHPALTFKATRFVEADELDEVETTLVDEAEVIAQITGVSESNTIAIESVANSDAPTKSKKLKEAEAEAEVTPKAKVKVEETADVEEAPAPKKKAVKIEEHDDIDAALDNLDFDD